MLNDRGRVVRSPRQQADDLEQVRHLLDDAACHDYVLFGEDAGGAKDVARLSRVSGRHVLPDEIVSVTGGFDHWKSGHLVATDLSAEVAAAILLRATKEDQ